MPLIDPSVDSPQDAAAFILTSALLLLSAASAAAVLYVPRRYCRRRLHDLVNPLWPVRLLLLFFASIWSISVLHLSPIVRRCLPPLIRRRPDFICNTFIVLSQAFAEPAFLAVLLFLLRASTRPKPASSASAFAAALVSALLSALPLLALHAIYLCLSTRDLRRLGILSDFFGSIIHSVPPTTTKEYRCSFPLFGTVLLALLASMYVPLFVSALWGAVSVVINRRLRARLFVLCVTVLAALSFQVAALALSTLWDQYHHDLVFQWLTLAATAAVVTLAATGEAILVVRPIIDALSVAQSEGQGTYLMLVRDMELPPVGGGPGGSC